MLTMGVVQTYRGQHERIEKQLSLFSSRVDEKVAKQSVILKNSTIACPPHSPEDSYERTNLPMY
jgi:hypothetical protein